MATYVVPGEWPGMVERGNIDLDNRPVVPTPTGGFATVRSASFGMPDGYEYLLPSVTQDGRTLYWAPDIVKQYEKTGQCLGKFKDPYSADEYARALHEAQENQYINQWNNKQSLYAPKSGGM